MDPRSVRGIGRDDLARDEIGLAEMEAVRGGCGGAAAGMEAQAQEPQPAAAAPAKSGGVGKQILSALLPMVTSALGGGTGAS